MQYKHWEAVTCSIVGDLHIKKNLPNQDAISFYKMPGIEPAFLIAVSDGHGSEKCPRSDVGSYIAVKTAKKVFEEYWGLLKSRFNESEIFDAPSTLANIERHIRKNLTKQLTQRWKNEVEDHIESEPFLDNHDPTNRLLAYGATLTVVFICAHFHVCLRLGDCEVLVADRSSKVHRVAPRDSIKVGEETDSLCLPKADKLFEVSFEGKNSPVMNDRLLYLICSDGYEKAFETNDGFERSALDFANLVCTSEGQETVKRELETWLREYSNYSGDDVTLGLLFNNTAPVESLLPGLESQKLGDGTDTKMQDIALTEKLFGDRKTVDELNDTTPNGYDRKSTI